MNTTHTLENALIALKQSENEVETANASYMDAVNARNFHKDFRGLLTGSPRYEFTPEGWVKELVRLQNKIEKAKVHFSKVCDSCHLARQMVTRLESAECMKNAIANWSKDFS